MTRELLTADSVAAWLSARGTVHPAAPISVEMLSGGVSNVVIGIEAGDQRLVVKQALPRLRVADDWVAKPERALTEAAAIALLHDVTPQAVPRVIDVDPSLCAIVIERAPSEWMPWKQSLLSGDVRPWIGAELGRLLAAWHAVAEQRLAPVDDPVAFDQLRVDPYYRTVALRAPDLAAPIRDLINGMLSNRARRLVHGDFSPKNMLVGPDGLWVIDFEVAHVGDPAFDVAFLTSHLLMKAVHRPIDEGALAETTERFWSEYQATAEHWPGAEHVLRHTGALLVARVDGKSPAEYLSAPGRDATRDIGRRLLTDPPDSLDRGWELVREKNA